MLLLKSSLPLFLWGSLVAANPSYRWVNGLTPGEKIEGYKVQQGDFVWGYRFGSAKECKAYKDNDNLLTTKSWWTRFYQAIYVDVKAMLGSNGVYLAAHYSMWQPPKNELYDHMILVIAREAYNKHGGELVLFGNDDLLDEWVKDQGADATTAPRFSYAEGWWYPDRDETLRRMQVYVPKDEVKKGKFVALCRPRGDAEALQKGPAPWITEDWKLTMKGRLEGRKDALYHWSDKYINSDGYSRSSDGYSNSSDDGEWECDFCYETFSSEEEQEQHEIDVHYHCADCDRTFSNYNAIKMHLNSRTHRGTDLACPFCKGGFATATGLSQHLEQRGCPRAPSLDRDGVYKIVCAKDPGGVISKNLIGWYGESPKYEATAQAWNGYAYECYICSRTFAALPSLNQHLASPVHKSYVSSDSPLSFFPSSYSSTPEANRGQRNQQNMYHCPKRGGCGREFTALMNHLESENCGYTRFENVQQSVKNVVSGDRRITFH
ncbi:Uu.00g049370.m01.CDS01 [Anthostomella pinea]|uniref:Uu.00g049370.m01.CDS01 n=1 Tax=Anthostomella pinea TaxID=933095 RepID=A0AAI8VBX0_9PEZI|nr:Uu.00g049370.m01.CDS01 [Anthostomella pinea]